MDLRQLVMLGLQVSIVCTVFGYGLKTTTADLLDIARRPALLVRSVTCVLVIVPALAYVLTRVFEIRHEVEVALVALAISPVPPLLPMKEMKAGGRISYGLGLLALLALLSVVTVPLAIEILGRLFNRPLAMDPFTVARLAFITVLGPLIAGVVVRARAPLVAERIAPGLSLGAKLLLVTAAIALLGGVWRSVWEATGQGAVVAMTVFIVGSLAVGHLLGGPERETSLVLGMSCACRHPAIAFAIASANFPDQRFGGAIILYLLLGLVIGAPYVRWNRSHRAVSTPRPLGS
jgi:BASS family bile acid:Na+ symporter